MSSKPDFSSSLNFLSKILTKIRFFVNFWPKNEAYTKKPVSCHHTITYLQKLLLVLSNNEFFYIYIRIRAKFIFIWDYVTYSLEILWTPPHRAARYPPSIHVSKSRGNFSLLTDHQNVLQFFEIECGWFCIFLKIFWSSNPNF